MPGYADRVHRPILSWLQNDCFTSLDDFLAELIRGQVSPPQTEAPGQMPGLGPEYRVSSWIFDEFRSENHRSGFQGLDLGWARLPQCFSNVSTPRLDR